MALALARIPAPRRLRRRQQHRLQEWCVGSNRSSATSSFPVSDAACGRWPRALELWRQLQEFERYFIAAPVGAAIAAGRHRPRKGINQRAAPTAGGRTYSPVDPDAFEAPVIVDRVDRNIHALHVR